MDELPAIVPDEEEHVDDPIPNGLDVTSSAETYNSLQEAKSALAGPQHRGKTVGHRMQHIYDKIGGSTRAGAALFAMENGVISRSSLRLETRGEKRKRAPWARRKG